MLLKAKIFCKRIFNYFGYTDKKIIGNGGLVLLKDYMNKIGLVEIFNQRIKDNRNQFQIVYRAPEILLCGILRILNGDSRLSHCENTSEILFSEMFTSKTIPDFRTLVYYFNRNPETSSYLEQILFEMAIKHLKEKIGKKKIKKITIDVDQTARAIHGRQEGAKKGYSARDRNSKLFQVAIWTIRETKTLLKLELRSGESHSAKDFKSRIKSVVENLKSLDLKLVFVIDSGYASTDLFEYLDSEGIEFICASKQTKAVKKRGKNAKNKSVGKYKEEISTVLKERQLKTKNNYILREIFVQNKIAYDEFGQQYFEKLDSNEFTNVFTTNMSLLALNVYNHYKGHAVIETIIEELKNDFKLALAHSNKFHFNESLAQLVAIAYNVKNLFVADVGFQDQGEETIMKLSTLRRKFIHTPALLVNNCGRLYFRFEKKAFLTFKHIFEYFDYKIQITT